MSTRTLGRWGEQLAESHLVKSGARVIARNYRSPNGEIDLLVLDEDDLVAVEVKTRTELDLEVPEEAIRRAQLRRIANALAEFSVEMGLEELHWRVDFVGVQLDLHGKVLRIEHLANVYPP